MPEALASSGGGRYQVTVRSLDRQPVVRTVTTLLDANKALAIAVSFYVRDHGDMPYAVEVEPLGPPRRSEGGTVDVGGDLFDRMEF